MAGKRADRASERDLERVLRHAREPFVSSVDTVGFSPTIVTIVTSARRIIETTPELFGAIQASGVREEGTLWFVGEVADGVRQSIGYDHHAPPTRASAAICASVFATVAYRHPYFDGNKRSAFLAAILVGRSFGFGIRETPYVEIESEVRDLTAREAGMDEVSDWRRRKVFIVSGEEEV